MASGGIAPTSGPGGKIAHDAFLKMSIPEATKKYLGTTRQKKDTQSIIDALEQGGLPRGAYNTVYAVLRRREKQVGDIINMQGDWALAEWYPNYNKKAASETDEEESASDADDGFLRFLAFVIGIGPAVDCATTRNAASLKSSSFFRFFMPQ